jgi:O-methyltransferase
MQNVVDWVTERHLSFSSRARLASVEALCKQAIAQTGSGSVVEFGMALGGTGVILAEAATTSGRSFHGFDVFKMIPEPTSPKDDDKSRDRYRVIASGKAKGHSGGEIYYGYRDDLEGEIKASLAERGVVVDGRKVALHKGLIQDTWPPLSWLSVAFAHVDCDWYDPVKCSLDHLALRVVPGGIIVVDDYRSFQGATLATDEFLADFGQTFEWLDQHKKAIVRKA